MPHCAVAGCTTSSKKRWKEKHPGERVSFHRLPRNEARKQAWLHAIRRQPPLPRNIFVCSKHFESRMFKRHLKSELTDTKHLDILLDDAVPTLFAHKKVAPKRLLSEKRALIREQRRVAEELLREADEEGTGASSAIDDIVPDDAPDIPMNASTTAETSVQTQSSARSVGTTVASPKMCTKATQCNERSFSQIRKVQFKDNGTMTDSRTFSTKATTTSNLIFDMNWQEHEDLNSSFLSNTIINSIDDSSESFHPSSESELSEPEDMPPSPNDNEEENNALPIFESPTADNKFIVFWSQLAFLFKFCMVCGQRASIISSRFCGSMVVVKQFCTSSHESIWRSQPLISASAAGNLLLAAGILFSGNTFARIKEMFDYMNLACVGKTRFYEIQNSILFPVIHQHFLKSYESNLVRCVAMEGVKLIGDGRCDSPGHSAKYGTYSVMDVGTNEVIDFSVVHVKQVTSSNAMEKHGLEEVIERVENAGVHVLSLTTDRHTQIRGFMKKKKPDIRHQFDIWHVGKSIKKKLAKAAKTKSANELHAWIKSVINHFWWSCATCKGDPDILKQKWLSLLHHIRNEHVWEDENGVHRCEHQPLSVEDKREICWLKEGSPALRALESVVASPTLLRDLPYLVDFMHTGQLEVYHSLMNKYLPKRNHFQLPAMIARTELCVMDHNSGVNRGQAKTQSGELRYGCVFPKQTKEWIAKPISETKPKTHVFDMMEDVVLAQMTGEDMQGPCLPNVPKNIAGHDRPSKEFLINNLQSRFGSCDQ